MPESTTRKRRIYTLIADRQRSADGGNLSTAPMQRTFRILQRRSPYSIATLHKQIAFALGPWLFDYLEAQHHRRPPRSSERRRWRAQYG